MRVGDAVVVMLPNIYTLVFRLQFLRGRLGPKYEFRRDNQEDRHRWVLGYQDAREFTHTRARRAGFTVAVERPFVYPFNHRSLRAIHAAARRLTGPRPVGVGVRRRLERR